MSSSMESAEGEASSCPCGVGQGRWTDDSFKESIPDWSAMDDCHGKSPRVATEAVDWFSAAGGPVDDAAVGSPCPRDACLASRWPLDGEDSSWIARSAAAESAQGAAGVLRMLSTSRAAESEDDPGLEASALSSLCVGEASPEGSCDNILLIYLN